jgi:GNAT superfamily N-acetyltransferase
VARGHRGVGLGSALLDWVIGEASRRGCALVQLTTDARRSDALRLYAVEDLDRIGQAVAQRVRVAAERVERGVPDPVAERRWPGVDPP